MRIYQADYADVFLELPVSLLISSVPLNILLEPSDFCAWMNNVMIPHGVVFIDMPVEAQYINSLYGALDTWRLQWNIELKDFYHQGNCQRLACFSKYPISNCYQVPYRKFSERQMQHPCEFDAVLINFLIKMFSKKDEIVLDTFCGTGLVPRTARDLNRLGIGIDKRCPFTNHL